MKCELHGMLWEVWFGSLPRRISSGVNKYSSARQFTFHSTPQTAWRKFDKSAGQLANMRGWRGLGRVAVRVFSATSCPSGKRKLGYLAPVSQ